MSFFGGLEIGCYFVCAARAPLLPFRVCLLVLLRFAWDIAYENSKDDADHAATPQNQAPTSELLRAGNQVVCGEKKRVDAIEGLCGRLVVHSTARYLAAASVIAAAFADVYSLTRLQRSQMKVIERVSSVFEVDVCVCRTCLSPAYVDALHTAVLSLLLVHARTGAVLFLL